MKGEEIKILRTKLKLSQEELAEMLGVTRLTVINYEKGGTIPASRIAVLKAILKGEDNTMPLSLDEIIYNRVHNRLLPQLSKLDENQTSLSEDYIRLFKVVVKMRKQIEELQLDSAKNRKSST